MAESESPYRIYGMELSPYSIKVRSYFRYKRIPHVWLLRNTATQDEFQRYAKLPLVPLVVTPASEGLQDSTPILERFEKLFPEPSIHPSDPAAAFVSAVLEEYGDEWVNKPMFHYRWTYEPDQKSAARRIARDMMPDLDEQALDGASEVVRGRMVPRLSFVGSSPATLGAIEGSFRRLVATLERHLDGRPYLFGGRPAFGDFGLYAQIYQAATDPTPGAFLRERAPRTLAWTERMLDPKNEGPFEDWQRLVPTLKPLLHDEVAGIFLPWSTANARALAAGEKEFSVELEGKPFRQETQKYHARSLQALKERYARVADRGQLDPLLEETGCRHWLV